MQRTAARRDNARLRVKTTMATWNLQGKLKQRRSQNKLVKDMKLRNVDIACLQETKWTEDAIVRRWEGEQKYRIINLAAATDNTRKQYGMGFYVAGDWVDRIVEAYRVTDRMAIIRFQIHEKRNRYLTIINVYGPTEEKARSGDTEDVTAFYAELGWPGSREAETGISYGDGGRRFQFHHR